MASPVSKLTYIEHNDRFNTGSAVCQHIESCQVLNRIIIIMPLNVAIIGSGLCGLACAISLRREGHHVTLYERYDFSGEVGSNISCASNGSRFLQKWGVDIERARPVVLTDMVWHDWSTGEITSKYPFGDYKGKFGTHYYSFHRRDIHAELKRTATSTEGQGPPAKLLLNHKAIGIDAERGWVKFENGLEITADLVIAADGIRVSFPQN